MTRSRLGLLASLLAVPLALTACSVSFGSSHEIDHAKAEKLLKDNITPTPSSVSCPSGVKEVKGGTFTCTFTLPSGKTGKAIVHMTDAKGGVHVSSSDITLGG